MAARIVINAGVRTRVRRPQLKHLSIATVLLCAAASSANASVLCFKGNSNEAGSYGTLYTGTDVLANGQSASGANGEYTQANLIGTQNAYIATPNSAGGYSTQGYVSTAPGNAAYQPGPYQSLATVNGGTSASVISFVQSASGSSSANPCASGGANSGNTLATIGDVNNAISKLPQLGGGDPNAVHYDSNGAGGNANSITLAATNVGPVGIHNVADGTTASDAATVGQLNASTTNVLNQANTYTDSATKYFKANSTGAAASATGTDAVAVGPNAVAGGSNSVALGNGSKATGNKSIAIGTGNVVSGTGSGAIGDPNTVSGSGSYALGNNNTIANNNTFVVGTGVSTTQDNSVVLGNASTDRAATKVTGTTINGTAYTFAGQGSAANGVVSVGAAGAERQVINVASGQVSATSTDAINGSQLYATNQAVAAIPVTGNNTSNRAAPTATGNDSVAVGHGSSATGNNSVAIGSGSVASRDNSVSVGAPGAERQITNVAAGTAPTDAATVGQVNAVTTNAVSQANSYTDQRIATVSKQVNAVGASAMAAAALQPNARAEGNFQVSAGAGTYGGSSALAIGAHYWASDRVLFNFAVTHAMGSGASTGASFGTTIGF